MDVGDFQLDDSLHKCRCCFRMLIDEGKAIEITEAVESKFFDLTQIQLIKDEQYSNLICELCDRDLKSFFHLKKDLSLKQQRLYELLPLSNLINYETTETLADNETIQIEQLDDEICEEIAAKTEHFEICNEESVKEIVEAPCSNFILATSELSKTNTRKWTCSSCKSSFKTRVNLREHKRNCTTFSKGSSERKMCQICGLSFAESGWYYHMLRAHTENIRFVCDVCNKGYRVKSDLKIHVQTHINPAHREKFPCTSCGAILLSKSALRNHEKMFHAKVIEEHLCECGKVFKSRMKLYQHRTTVHVRGVFPCSHCEASYTTKAVLQKHISKNHKEKIPCEICGKLLPHGHFMNTHMKSHGEPEFKCQECNKEFHLKTSLNYHIDSVHKPSENLVCPTCNSSYNSIRNLKRHVMRQHSGFRVHCEIEGCEHTTGRKDYLRAHYLAHKDIDKDTKQVLINRVKDLRMIPW